MKVGTGLTLAAATILGTTGCSNKIPTLNSQLGGDYTPKITEPIDETKISVHNIQESDKTNFTVYGAGMKNINGNSNGVGFKYEGKNYILSAEMIEDLKKVSAIIINKIGKNIYLRGGAGYLEKDFEYKGTTYTAEQLKLGMALLYTDNKSYNIELGQIEAILKGLDNADTISHITFINGTYKKGDFDVHGTAKNANVYGENFTEFSAGAGYYPTDDSRIGAKYSSFQKKQGDYAIRAGLTYTFGKGEEGKLSPYINASYNASDHVTTTVNYENNIAKKPINLRDEFRGIINGSDITAQRYNPKEFNKRLDQNIEDRNKAPIAKNDIAKVEEGKIYNIDVLFNDIDPEGKKLILTSILESDGDFKISGDKIKFNAKKAGTFVCTYEISDGSKADTAKLTVTVTEKPKPVPVPENIDAHSDTFSTKFNTPVSGNVLANDKKDKTTEVFINKRPPNGVVVLLNNGNFTYTPKTNFEGKDTFIYKIKNQNGQIDYAQVTINISKKPTPSNTAPEANNDSATTNSNTTITVDVLGNDTDANNDTLTITEIKDKVGGEFTIVSGKIKFVPTNTFSGDASCTYKISDGKGGFDTAKLKITVKAAPTTNEEPVAVSDNYSTPHNTVFTGNVVSNDTDAEGDTITVISNTNPSKGTVSVNSNGSFTYTPNNGATGTDTFTYTVNGGSTATVTMNIDSARNTDPTLNLSMSGTNFIDNGNGVYDSITGGTITFDMSGSNDSDGNVVRYVIDGLYDGANSTFTMSTAGKPYGSQDNYTVKVYDDYGAVSLIQNITINYNI